MLKRRLNNNINFIANENPVVCQWCDKTGHLANNSWKILLRIC